MKIICINGYPQSGKDTFVNFCYSFGSIIQSYSTVDFVKKIAKECGWNGVKDLKSRKFLSDLKDILTEWDDIPVRDIKRKILEFIGPVENLGYNTDKIIFFIHTREPKELQRFKDEFGAKTLLIQRPSVENNEQSNHADKEVLNFNYDYVIDNDGTLEDLQKKADSFIINILKENWNSYIEEEF